MTLLRMVNVRDVGPGNINYVFSPAGYLTETPNREGSAAIFGTGTIGCYIFQGEDGAPAAGLYGYEYDIDLRRVQGDHRERSVTALSVDFGPVVDYLDYDGDGRPDQVFVVADEQGAQGYVGPQSADQRGSYITFTFDPPVRAGEQSYIFGLASRYRHIRVDARVSLGDGSEASVRSWAPDYLAGRGIVGPELWGRVIGSVPYDGGGAIILPGGIPLPIGPWDPTVDVLVALGAYKIAEDIKDSAARTKLQAASMEAIGELANKLSQKEIGDADVGKGRRP
jgi:hypothetical protein